MICQFPLAASFSPTPNDQCVLCTLTLLLLICSFSYEVYFRFLIPLSFPVYCFFCPLAIDSFKHTFSLAKIQLKRALPQKRNRPEKLSFHHSSGWHLPTTLLSIFLAWLDCKTLPNYWIKKKDRWTQIASECLMKPCHKTQWGGGSHLQQIICK